MSETIKINTGTEQLLCEVQDRVAIITLNRPEARNALSDELTPALRLMVKERGEDPHVGAVLITGSGTAFCAGGDVKGMGGNSPKKQMTAAERAAELKIRQRTLTGAIVALRKPTIAALPGPAAGAGLSIALACDIRIAAASAFISTGYSRVGLSGDYGISYFLTQLAGTAKARELMFTAERVEAAQAQQLGLINQVVPDEDLRQTAFEFACQLANGPTLTFAAMKDNLDRAQREDLLMTLDGEADNLVNTAQTDDHKEAVRAFIDKREPEFKGR
jgi:enoyl-CoA hydratase/carnithine racemase